jgi:hypothetical protein
VVSLSDDEGWIGRWSPGIGDPTLLGWFTVAAYLAAALLCLRASRVAQEERSAGAQHSSQKFWSVGAMGLFGLGVNKQLDLQSAFTELGRFLAKEQGWYDDRRTVQLAFIAVVLAAALIGLGWLVRVSWKDVRRLWLAIVGAAGLAAFVAVRASSFHHVDILLGEQLLGLRWNGWLELGGIACLAVAAARFGRCRSRG